MVSQRAATYPLPPGSRPEQCRLKAAIPLIVNGKLIGAVGASGGTSDQDGMVANAGAAVINNK